MSALEGRGVSSNPAASSGGARAVLARTSAVVLVLAALTSPAMAQNYQQVAPKTPAPNPTAAPELPQSTVATLPKGEQTVVPALKGLVFVGAAAKVNASGATSPGIETHDVPVLDQAVFRDEMSTLLGKTLTFDGLNQIQKQVVAFYRMNDRPLVDVAVPEQNIQSGIVQIVVTEFKVGSVVAEGNKYVPSERLVAGVRVKPGDTVRGSELIADINWINQNPFRQVDLVYRRDPKPDTTDIVLRTADRFPLRAYVGFDNSGTPLTGRGRWNLGFNWGNALWLDQLFSYQFTSSNDFWTGQKSGQRDANFLSHSVDWVIPLPWRHKIEIFGAYQQSVPNLGPNFGELGVSGQASIRYIAPLPSVWGISQELRAGYDFKTTNNDLAFGGTSVSTTATDIHQFTLIHYSTLPDRLGKTELTNSFYFSPGGLSADNKDAVFGASQPFAKATYFYWNVAIDRQTILPWDLTWALRIQAQLSDGNLLPSEQLGAGGAGLVRGYNLRVVNGDQGVLISNELRSKVYHLLPDAYADQLQLFAFIDYGTVHDVTPPGTQPNGGTLASIGPGLRYSIGPYLDLRTDAGFQLRSAPNSRSTSELADIALTLSY
jgi:hemolysin activation/secretion protein